MSVARVLLLAFASGSAIVRGEGMGAITQGDGVPHKSHAPSNKIPMPGLESLPLSCWLGLCNNVLNQNGLLPSPLVAFHNLNVRP